MLRGTVRCLSSANKALSLGEYQRALEFMKTSDFKAAEAEFHRCLAALDAEGLHADTSYNFILTRVAAMQRAQLRFKDCEMSLERVAKNYQNRARDYPEQLSRAYINLMMQYLHSNVVKGIVVGNAMLKEPYWSELTREAQKDIHFLLGVLPTQTALLLHGKDFAAAKKQLKSCLQKSPGSNSCFILHNLACAQWWHMGLVSDNDSEQARAVALDYSECVPNMCLAVNLFEGRTGNYALDSSEELKNPLTGLTLTNIAEFLIDNEDWEVLSHAGCTQVAD